MDAVDVDNLHCRIGQRVVNGIISPRLGSILRRRPPGNGCLRIRCSGRPSRGIGCANAPPVKYGTGASRDNRMIERLWRSLKYECVYLNAFETGTEMRSGIGKWLTYYNSERPHSTHGIVTPDEAYDSRTEPMRLAA